MPVKEIDRDKLRTAIRKMGDEYSYYLLDDAIDLLPQTKLAKLIKGYFDPEKLRPDGKKQTLINDVKAFRDASLRSEYYESSDVNWKNSTQTSRGTRAWISGCNRLLDRLVAQSIKNMASEIVSAFDVIFGLLDHIDECLDNGSREIRSAGCRVGGQTPKRVQREASCHRQVHSHAVTEKSTPRSVAHACFGKGVEKQNDCAVG